MLQYSTIVLHQMLIMFLLMAVGYLVFRRGILDNHTTKQVSVLLNTVVVPCNILNSFNRAYDGALAHSLALTFLAAIVIFLLSIALVNALYRPGKRKNYGDCRLCALLSNNGFMALPLLSALFGDTGVFLGAAHIVVMTVILWVYGVRQVSPGRPFSARAIFLNPGVVAAALGLGLFLLPVSLPADLSGAIAHIANLNTPLAMLILGGYLAQVDLRACFSDARLWRISAVRLLVIPAMSIVVLLLLPLDPMAKLTVLVGSAAPSAVVAAMFAQMYDTDYLFSTRVVALTSLLSIVTLPAVIALMSFLLA